MHSKDWMTDHQKQKMHKGNTNHNWAISTGPIEKNTKTDSLEDFLKQCESQVQHNKTNTYNGHLDNSPNENTTRNMQQGSI